MAKNQIPSFYTSKLKLLVVFFGVWMARDAYGWFQTKFGDIGKNGWLLYMEYICFISLLWTLFLIYLKFIVTDLHFNKLKYAR